MAGESISHQFAKKLASNEKLHRDRAIRKLRTWLTQRSAVKDAKMTKEEFLCLWKGLFYCMWMSDKPLVQEELADSISRLISCIQDVDSALLFIDTFFETMHREWPGIDYLRIDKFMMLVRKFLAASFSFLSFHEWKESVVDEFNKVVSNSAVCPEKTGVGVGFQLHIADIYMEELAREAAGEVSGKELTKFLTPFCNLLVTSKNPVLRKTVIDRVFKFTIRLSDDDSEAEEEEIDEEQDANAGVDEPKNEENDEPNDDTSSISSDDDDKFMYQGQREWRHVVRKHERETQKLPFPKFDYQHIGDTLLDIAGKATTLNLKHRTQVYEVVKLFHEMANGIFPLDSVELSKGTGLRPKDYESAARRLLDEDEEHAMETLKWKLKNKNKKKRDIESDEEEYDSEELSDEDYDMEDEEDDENECEEEEEEENECEEEEDDENECKEDENGVEIGEDQLSADEDENVEELAPENVKESKSNKKVSEAASPVKDKLLERLLANKVNQKSDVNGVEEEKSPKKGKKRQREKIPKLVPIIDNAQNVNSSQTQVIADKTPSLEEKESITNKESPTKRKKQTPEVATPEISKKPAEVPKKTGKKRKLSIDKVPEVVVVNGNATNNSVHPLESTETRLINGEPLKVGGGKESITDEESPKNPRKKQKLMPEATTPEPLKVETLSKKQTKRKGANSKIPIKTRDLRSNTDAKKMNGESRYFNMSNNWNEEQETEVVIELKNKNKPKPNSSDFASFDNFMKSPPVFFRSAVAKASPNTKKAAGNLSAAALMNSKATTPSKKVSFELTKNIAHEHKEYAVTVRSSPSIPYNAKTVPTQGVLKVKEATPKKTGFKSAQNFISLQGKPQPQKRTAAKDYFVFD